MIEEWYNVNEKLPAVGQRVRVLVVKEMVYKGNLKDNESDWLYDQYGEHGIYSWNPKLSGKNEMDRD